MGEAETIDNLIRHFTIEYDQASDFFETDGIFQTAIEASFNDRSIKELACNIVDARLITFFKHYRSSFDKLHFISTYYKSIFAIKSRFKNSFIEGYKLAIKGEDYLFNDMLSVQYNLLKKANIPKEQTVYWVTMLCFEYIMGYSSCVLQSEIKRIAADNGLNLNYDSLTFNMSESKNRNEMDSNQIKIDVKPQITISPQFTNNPTFNINTTEIKQKKEEASSANIDSHGENLKVKQWKNKALLTFGLSFFTTVVLVIISLNKWILTIAAWRSLEAHDVIKWIGIALGVIWNGFIVKSLYDRFWDPSKEKAFREGLRKSG